MNIIKSSEITSRYRLEHFGPEVKIKKPCALKNLKNFSISWSKKKVRDTITLSSKVPKNLFLVLPSHPNQERPSFSYCIAKDPRTVFNKILTDFFYKKLFEGISASSKIGKNVIYGKNFHVGVSSVLKGKINVGDNCYIDDNCTLKGPLEIGDDVEILPGAILGFDSLGVTIENDVPKLFPQLSGLKIGNNCRIGVNCSISKGTLDYTYVGNNVMLGDFAHIGHNSIIGDNVVITAGSIICGKVEIDQNVWIGARSTILEGIKICSNAKIGLGAVVLKNITKPGTYLGNPAKLYKI